ncbi:MAG: archaemetzincin family Zn-dependent metalloprotease [Bacteroidales bacterium]|nr:archaemetzincin family Zn-dependent metalloprotease [Bacteroidales bacterium]
MSQKTIILVTCGTFEKEITDCVASHIERELKFAVLLKRCTLDLGNFYNPGRRQYDANLILKAISERVPEGFIKAIGLLKVDLYIPILTYIFGQGFLNGHTAIASLFRLRNELYGLKPDNNLLLERFSKVVLHELGHTFGLIHCLDPVCIMRSGTYVEDLDQKDVHFCHSCREELSKGIL